MVRPGCIPSFRTAQLFEDPAVAFLHAGTAEGVGFPGIGGDIAAKLGEMFYFLELCCGVSAYMLGVNPFNQPGVEFYKRNMFQLLGTPGYEA